MRGFTGFYHYGHPCFVREEYEAAHEGENELQRLENALDMSFSDMNTAANYALTHARYLLYRCESDDIDRELLGNKEKWVPFQSGYVHAVTGEFVYGAKPTYDSYPCWKIDEPASRWFDPNSALQTSGKIGLLAMALNLIAAVVGGRNNG